MELCYSNNQKSLFRKYAHLVTWFSNTRDGRAYLGDNFKDEFGLKFNDHIGLFLPNGFIKHNGGKKAQLVVTTRAIYAPKLYEILRKIDYFSNIATFDELQKLLLYETDLVKPYSKLAPRYDIKKIMQRVMWESVVINPDANPETTSVDGNVARSGVDETFATIRSGAGNGSSDTSGSGGGVPRITATVTNNQYSLLTRGIFLFDTSALSPDDELASGIFSLYLDGAAQQLGQSLNISSSNPASNTALVNNDYAVGNFGATKFASDIAITAVTINQYSDWTLNASGKSAIAVDGITKFGFRVSGDIDNSAPTWVSSGDDFVTPIFAEFGSNKPKLTINYSAGMLMGTEV